MKALIATAAATAASFAQAHAGHGMEDADHWHATDVWGFVLIGAVMAASLWARRGR